MKLFGPFQVAATAIFICMPVSISARHQHTFPHTWLHTNATSIHDLAPSQRDINIAILAVIAGNLLIGYEKVVRQHSMDPKANYEKRRPRKVAQNHR